MEIKITTDEMDNTIITVYFDGLTMQAVTLTPKMVQALKQHFTEQGE
jgi:hypothetical protein